MIFSAEPEFTRNQGLTFEQTNCPSCELFTSCGGSATAPCHCIFHPADPRYHACDECDIICRERDVEDRFGGVRDSFETHYRDGLALSQVETKQHKTAIYPVFIPARTQELTPNFRLPVTHAAVDLRSMFRIGSAGRLLRRPIGADGLEARARMRVLSQTSLVGVLNGLDPLLEGFWGKDRMKFYNRMHAAGISAITGPTFSIYGENNALPSSHNVLALSRHNRCLQEISDAGFDAIPNIYWRSRRDLEQWIEYLSVRPQVSVISRDFSCTKQYQEFLEHFEGLKYVLRGSGRPLHVMLVGIGVAKAPSVIGELAMLGCTCSIITGSPVMAARSGGRRLVVHGNALEARIEEHVTHAELIAPNLVEVERYLTAVALQYPIYSNPYNGMLMHYEPDEAVVVTEESKAE